MRYLPLPLTVCTVVKSKGRISQNFVVFSEYMNFNSLIITLLLIVLGYKDLKKPMRCSQTVIHCQQLDLRELARIFVVILTI